MAILSNRMMLKDIRVYESAQRHPAYLTNRMKAETSVKAEEYLAYYEKDGLDVMAKDYKLFAEYINAFASDNRDNLLNKLQTSASFDVREYLKTHRIVAYGQQKEYENYLDSQKLSRFIGTYNALRNRRRSDRFGPDDGYELLNMISASENYVRDFLDNKFDLYTSDIPLFKRYIKVTLENNPVLANEALNKIETGHFGVREHETPKSPAEALGEKMLIKISAFKAKAKSFFGNTKKRVSGFFKSIFGRSENKLVKSATPSIVTAAAVTALTLVSDTPTKQIQQEKDYNFKQKHEMKNSSDDKNKEEDKTTLSGRTKIIEKINADIINEMSAKEMSARAVRKNLSDLRKSRYMSHKFKNLKEWKKANTKLKAGR